ncbi:MAG TPA: hypothetical protein VM054_08260 [bacterium]|nr:hypothetical protein [bacterium]
MRIGWMIFLPLCLATVAMAAETQTLPDPFLDGLSIGDTSLQIEATLKANGWETSNEWYNVETDPVFRVRGESGNRKLIYDYDVYGRLIFLTYLEQWPSIAECKKAFSIWREWLQMYYGEPIEVNEHDTHWSNSGYEIKIYDKTFIASESTTPTTMVNIYPLRVP